MAGKQLDTEALLALENAVKKFRNELDTNRAILINAANVCDQAMGSDQISKNQIAKLNEALKNLEKTSKIAEDVTREIHRKYVAAKEFENM